MLIRLAAVACLALPLAAQVEDPAKLVPPNTMVYFGTHSVRVASQAARNSAMSRILGEPEVKAFLQKPVAAAQAIVDSAIAESGIAEADGRQLSLADMMSAEGEGPPVGRMFIALTHVELPPASPEGAAAFPDMGVVVGMELIDAHDLALVKALWSKIPAPEESASHDGHSYFKKTGDEGWSVSLVFLGNLAVVSASDKTLFDVMARYDGKAGSTGSLADTPEYRKLLSTAGGLVAGASTSFVRVGELARVGTAALAKELENDEETKEMAPKILAAIDGLGLQGLEWMGSVSSRNADGKVAGTSTISLSKGATGLVPTLMRSAEALDTARLSRVPGNSLSVSTGTIDGLADIYDFAMTTFESLAPETCKEVQAQISKFMGGSDLRSDILANLHGTFVTYSVPGEGYPGTPSSIFRVNVHDPDKFIGALQSLVTNASNEFLANQPVALKESDHEGRRLFELDLSRTPVAVVPLSPAFALDGNEFVASLESVKTLKSDLNGSAGPGSITENAELMAFIETLSKSGTLRDISFSDNAATFGAVYGQLSGAVNMLSGSLGNLPVDFSLLPTEAVITKHLGNSYSGTYADADGTTIVNRSVSQFQVGDFVPLLITAGALGIAGASGESLVEVREATPEEQVQEDLAQISAGMTVYKIAEGRLPDAIADLVKPLADYPDGCLGRKEVPVDPWGNAYFFRLNEKKKPFLWSSGPDGIDQQGQGDDIVKK